MPPAKRKPTDTEHEHDETQADAPEPKPEPATVKSLGLADHLERASAPREHLTGWARIEDALEVAFVHALAGSEKQARELLADADAEWAKFPGSFDHLTARFSLLYGRVLAALKR